MSTPLFSVADVAARLNLKAQTKGGKLEYHGANPTGNGATKDGFILYPAGNAYDRALDKSYNSPDVAVMAQIAPDDYEGCAPVSGRTSTSLAKSATLHTTRAEEKPKPFPWATATIHAYCYPDGSLAFQTGRTGTGETKDIRYRRPNGKGGWLYNLAGIPHLNYLREKLPSAEVVFVVEGEKSADALNDELRRQRFFPQYIATTNRGGVDKWHRDLNAALAGKRVYVLPDNDKQGERHARQVLASLAAEPMGARPAHLARLDLPNLPAKGDVADWLAGENLLAELLDLQESAPHWEPPADAEKVTEEGAQSAQGLQFHFQTLSQLKQKPPPQWLIHRFLTVGGTSILTAKHGSYKSFFAIDMALCVATGSLWQGFEVQRGRVVYVAAEGASGLTKRATAWERRHKRDYDENLLVLDAPLKVHEEGVRAAFIAQLRALNPVLIVLDTLARCAVGLDENSSGDMGVFADAIGEVARETGAHVMVVHHNNKTGEYRGSTALPAAVDTHLSLERTGGDTSTTCTLKTEKQKDFEAWAAMGFEGNAIALTEGGEETSLVFEKAEIIVSKTPKSVSPTAEDKVFEMLEAIATEEGVTSALWLAAVEATGMSKATFDRARRVLTRGSDTSPVMVEIISGEEGGQGVKAARYAPKLLTSVTSVTSITTPVAPLDNLAEKPVSPVSPPFRGDTVDTGLEVVTEELKLEMASEESNTLGELKPKKRSRKANADSEPYAAPSSGSATDEQRAMLARALE